VNNLTPQKVKNGLLFVNLDALFGFILRDYLHHLLSFNQYCPPPFIEEEEEVPDADATTNLEDCR
jgi:hypothetical protein